MSLLAPIGTLPEQRRRRDRRARHDSGMPPSANEMTLPAPNTLPCALATSGRPPTDIGPTATTGQREAEPMNSATTARLIVHAQAGLLSVA
jgi:hypothetical protein